MTPLHDYAYLNAYVKREFRHIVIFRNADGKWIDFADTETEAREKIDHLDGGAQQGGS